MSSLLTTLSARQKQVVGVAVGCALLLLMVRFVYLPVLGTIRERRATLQDLQVKIADAQTLAARLPAEEVALEQVQERYDTLEDWIGNGESVARILETLSRQANDHQLELVAVQPPAKEGEAVALNLGSAFALREVPLDLTLTGRYWHIGEFLGELAEVPFVASVRSLRLAQPEAASQQLQAEVVLAIYVAEGTLRR